MAFLKGVKDQIDVKLTVNVTSDNGRTIKVPFVATYKWPTVQESKEVLSKCRSEEMGDEDVIDQYLIGWKGLEGADGEQVEFCPEALKEAMSHKDYRRALVEGFLGIATDKKLVDAVLAKNS